MDEQGRTATGLWKALDEAELGAARTLTGHLAEFAEAVEHCYEAGVEAPTIPGKRHGDEHLASALYLKKALTDLRAMWLLLARGYTSPAAAVAASLWENACAADVIAGDSNLLTEVRKEGSGDLPWRPGQLAHMIARRYGGSEEEIERHRLSLYAPYKWLCKIKHPTFRSAVHDAGSTKLQAGQFVVMGAPDTRMEDRPVKAMVLLITLTRLSHAIEQFAEALDPDHDSAEYARFKERIRKMSPGMAALHDATADELPFTIADEAITRQYRDFLEEDVATPDPDGTE